MLQLNRRLRLVLGLVQAVGNEPSLKCRFHHDARSIATSYYMNYNIHKNVHNVGINS